MSLKAIAFYLPQFHPIPENNAWWGKGFTEWTSVTRARPFYEKHYQPRLPTDLGYYDLRVPETRNAQAELAKAYGLYGFCYYYYWFGGKKLLHEPLEAVLKSKEPDFPFCICWANQNWTRRWDGMDNEILISQTASSENELAFIQDVIPLLEDDRYIRINGKPLLLVYRPEMLPDSKRVTDAWREETLKRSIGDLFLVRCEHSYQLAMARPSDLGFDASYEFPPHRSPWHWLPAGSFQEMGAADSSLNILDYKSVAVAAMSRVRPDYKLFRGVMLHWDNTPRQGKAGIIYENFSSGLYESWLTEACLKTIEWHGENERLVFINAWNEWAEGAYLEPDVRYGRLNLDCTKRAINTSELYARLTAAPDSVAGTEVFHPSMLGDYFRNQLSLIEASSQAVKQYARELDERDIAHHALTLRRLAGHALSKLRARFSR